MGSGVEEGKGRCEVEGNIFHRQMLGVGTGMRMQIK
jgi:hypothetical protein